MGIKRPRLPKHEFYCTFKRLIKCNSIGMPVYINWCCISMPPAPCNTKLKINDLTKKWLFLRPFVL